MVLNETIDTSIEWKIKLFPIWSLVKEKYFANLVQKSLRAKRVPYETTFVKVYA